MDHNKLWKTLKEMGISDHLTCLLRNLSQVKKQLLEPDMEQLTGSNLRKEYDKAIFYYPVYLIWTSSEIPGWMVYKLELRWSGEISTTSDIQMIPL